MRLIDADKVGLTDFEILMCDGDYKEALKMVLSKIDNAPTVDAVPVIRCKECEHAHMTFGGECKYCDEWEEDEYLYLDGDFFCAFGKRRNEDDETD